MFYFTLDFQLTYNLDERSSVYESEPELRAKKASGERKKGSSIGKPNKKTLRNNGDRSNIEKGTYR